MMRMLIQFAINVVAAALGLLVAAALLGENFKVQPAGFIVAVLVFAVVSAIFGPFVFNLARKYASALLGGIGIVSTLIGLWVATLFTGGLTIVGWQGWLGGAVIVWLVTALGGWFFLWFALKRKGAGGKAG